MAYAVDLDDLVLLDSDITMMIRCYGVKLLSVSVFLPQLAGQRLDDSDDKVQAEFKKRVYNGESELERGGPPLPVPKFRRGVSSSDRMDSLVPMRQPSHRKNLAFRTRSKGLWKCIQ